MRRRAVGIVALLAACGCTGGVDPAPSPSSGSSGAETAVERPEADLGLAVSEPVEDAVYPHVGDPGVDALHYDLGLDWDPEARVLTGTETLTFRATRTAPRLQLDLSAALEVASARLDGEEVPFRHNRKDLVVRAPVEQDARYVLEVSYSGTPVPTAAPTTRSDFNTTGWTTTRGGETWTMQEPFGAYTWYAVNDQPSDKALYDFTISVPSPWVGVANGELTSRTDRSGTTTTTWRLAEPAASYLVTVATGDFTLTQDTSASGVPISYWTPTDQPDFIEPLRQTPAALEWLEERLGPYPFDTLGIVVVDSLSGMETQTMITLGDNPFATSPEVLVHELAHQWWGDQVTPTDWFDLWMNEGMAMYLQGAWEAEQANQDFDVVLDQWAAGAAELRAEAGPPGAYDPARFGESNVYHLPALMWHEVRERVGERAFWRLVREWPASRDNDNATTEELLAWVEAETGEELTALFEGWLFGARTPPRD